MSLFAKKQIEKKLKELQTYLGPRVNYSMDSWSSDTSLRFIQEYYLLLQETYYKNLKKKSIKRTQNKKSIKEKL